MSTHENGETKIKSTKKKVNRIKRKNKLRSPSLALSDRGSIIGRSYYEEFLRYRAFFPRIK